MPALITHNLFGQEAKRALDDTILTTPEETLAFLLGNQGPDPLFSRGIGTLAALRNCHELAHLMHDQKVVEAFLCLRQGVSMLPVEDQGIGRAFVLGFLGHYTLDSRAHCFIYGQQYALIAANDQLKDAQSEVHAVIESDIDTWMLWNLRQATTLEVPPASCLTFTPRIARVCGALMSDCARQIYGIALNAEDFGWAVHDYQTLFKMIEPLESPKNQAIAYLERVGRPHSMASALAHSKHAPVTCAAANLDHKPWTNPYTQEVRTESFADLFYGALDEWPTIAIALMEGNVDALESYVGQVNYDSKPVEQEQ